MSCCNCAFPGSFAVTPSNTVDLAHRIDGVWIGGAGNLTYTPLHGGSNVTLTAVPAGTFLPIQASRILSTGTTATLIVGLYRH